MATYLTVIFIIFLILIFLGIKWEIKLSIVIPWAVFMAVLGSAAVLVFRSMYSHTSSFVPMAAGLILSGTVTIVVTLFFFFRDPERDPPDRGGNVLAPADGKVVYVKEIKDGEFPFAIKGKRRISLKEFTDVEFISGKGIQIGIAMNLLNVHVNRAPIEGRIILIKRIPGGFFSLKKISSLLENERVFTAIDNGEISVGVVQIASRLVRRISSYLRQGDQVQIGQRFGIIRFGSQVDLLIPYNENLRVMIQPGDEVKAGISIIARY